MTKPIVLGVFDGLPSQTMPSVHSIAPSNVPSTVRSSEKNPNSNPSKCIDSFRDDYAFLSNFAYSPIRVNGQSYATVEHAYQSAKTKNPAEREAIRTAWSPAQAKRLGNTCTKRKDWEDIRWEVMYLLCKAKYKPGSPLAAQLIATGDAQLIEGNYWNDTFWGVCKGKGENHLGRILMTIRNELKENL